MRSRSPIYAEATRQWHEMRAEFELTLYAAYDAAEEATRGAMVNAEGRAAGVDSFSLMTGPWVRVAKYGTRELVEHFQAVGRPCMHEFEREWLDARLDYQEGQVA